MDHSDYEELLEIYKEERVPVVLTASEAMDILRVGKNTMYRLLNSGELPATRVGRTWRIPLESISLLCNLKKA